MSNGFEPISRRPAVSEQRLSLLPNGQLRDHLKTPYRDGTTHVIFEPLDFIARLTALGAPAPWAHLTRQPRPGADHERRTSAIVVQGSSFRPGFRREDRRQRRSSGRRQLRLDANRARDGGPPPSAAPQPRV
jgi:hypothetical protein